jgi:hypothetical protein
MVNPRSNLSRSWGKWPSEAFTTSGRADGFVSRAASAIRGKFCLDGLTEMLMLLELCEFCCAGAAHLSGAGLRRRKHGRSTFGAKGLEEPEAPRVGCASARGWRRPGRDVLKGTRRPGRDRGLFQRRRCGVTEDHVWFEDRWMVASLCDE